MLKYLPVYLFVTTKDWEDWLSDNHNKLPPIWMKFAKKNTGAVSISYDEALSIALCYGWIDGLINKYDEKYYVMRFSPRKPQSVWSKSNRVLIEKLLGEGKVQPGGLATIEAAKANGRWKSAYDSSANMQMPEDFLKELAKDKKAEEFFKTLNRANIYAICWRLQTAKRAETRTKRMEKILEMMKRRQKFH